MLPNLHRALSTKGVLESGHVRCVTSATAAAMTVFRQALGSKGLAMATRGHHPRAAMHVSTAMSTVTRGRHQHHRRGTADRPTVTILGTRRILVIGVGGHLLVTVLPATRLDAMRGVRNGLTVIHGKLRNGEMSSGRHARTTAVSRGKHRRREKNG